MDLASLAAAGQAETGTRQAGAQQLQSAAHAQALDQQLGQLAAESEAARRNYSFQGEQQRLDHQLQLGLAQAQAARARSGGGGGSNRTAELQFQMMMQQMENEEWYKRQQFLAALEGKGQGNSPRNFGSGSTSGGRGQALVDLTDRYGRKEISAQDYVREGGGGSGAAVNQLRGARGEQYLAPIRQIRDAYSQDPAKVVSQTEAYFRNLAKQKGSIVTPSTVDEWASVALWNIGYAPELG